MARRGTSLLRGRGAHMRRAGDDACVDTRATARALERHGDAIWRERERGSDSGIACAMSRDFRWHGDALQPLLHLLRPLSRFSPGAAVLVRMVQEKARHGQPPEPLQCLRSPSGLQLAAHSISAEVLDITDPSAVFSPLSKDSGGKAKEVRLRGSPVAWSALLPYSDS